MLDHPSYETSQRLRYESFANLSSRLSEADRLEVVAQALADHLKYIVNVSVSRFLILCENQTVLIETDLAKGYVVKDVSEPLSFERQVLEMGIPVLMTQSEMHALSIPLPSILSRHPVANMCAFPVIARPNQRLLLTIGTKEPLPYRRADYRFFQLIGQFLLNKVSEIMLRQRLESIVQRRTQALEQSNNELNTLFYRLSHNFRSPLTSLLGLFRLISDTLTTPGHAELLQKCKDVVYGMDGMLNKLNILSSLDMLLHHMEFIHFERVEQTLRQHFGKELEQRAVQLEFTVTAAEPLIFYPPPLEIILNHTVENAISFFKAAQENKRIRVTIAQKGDALVLTIADNGPGIRADHLPYVFDPYFQGDKKERSDGLGLYIVKKLVEVLHGQVEIDSQLGEGTTVEVSLPLPSGHAGLA